MFLNKGTLVVSLLFLLAFGLTAASAQGNKYREVESISYHLKSKYRAKQVHIPFMWLARAAVKVVRPAGVKSFSITLFKDLKFSRDTLDLEMQSAMKQSFSPEWSSIFHVRSRDGQQAHEHQPA